MEFQWLNLDDRRDTSSNAAVLTLVAVETTYVPAPVGCTEHPELSHVGAIYIYDMWRKKKYYVAG